MDSSINFWSVPKLWTGQTAVIFASGPSLNHEQIDYVRRKDVRTIAINRTIEAVPWADVHYFCDHKFYNWLKNTTEYPCYAPVRAAYDAFKGYKITISQHQTDALHLKRGFQRGISDEPDTLCTGNNSGYQAINLAYLFGASRIILLGYDQRAVNGKVHHHAEHPRATSESVLDSQLECWPYLEQAIRNRFELINCTPGSRIECFQKMDLRDALNDLSDRH